jgi:hypothetical protein
VEFGPGRERVLCLLVRAADVGQHSGYVVEVPAQPVDHPPQISLGAGQRGHAPVDQVQAGPRAQQIAGVGLAVRDDTGPASLPDPVEQGAESGKGLAQRLFVPGQQVTARLGVWPARPRDAQAGQGLVDTRAAGQFQRLAGDLDALRGYGMQPGQQVDDRGPVTVIDRVVEVTRRSVEVREQRQGTPGVQEADDLTGLGRHGSDDEGEPGLGCGLLGLDLLDPGAARAAAVNRGLVGAGLAQIAPALAFLTFGVYTAAFLIIPALITRRRDIL